MTRTGRPAFRSELDPDNPGPIETAWCPLDNQSRIAVPSALVRGLAWAEPGNAECLLVLEAGGRVLLHDWASRSVAVLGKRAELIDAVESDAAAERILATLQDRYRRAPMLRRQVKLHRPVLSHLFGDSTHGEGVLLVRFPEHLELWSSRYRDERFRIRPKELDDLP